nr:MAG TPA: hypothetical protein [Caudoviricetes sp.]
MISGGTVGSPGASSTCRAICRPQESRCMA